MAYQLLSPGVQVNEIDYSDYVAAAATCIIGMVGGARRGPTVPTLVTTQEQFIKLFGIPSTKDYGGYSALQALTQASQLYYQRAYHKPTAARAGEPGKDKLIFTLINTGAPYNGYTISLEAVPTKTPDPNESGSGSDGEENKNPDIGEVEVTPDPEDWLSDATPVEGAFSSKDFNVVLYRPRTPTDGEGDGPIELERYEHCSIDTDDLTNVVNNRINGVSKLMTVSLRDEGDLVAKTLTFTGGSNGASYGTAGGADQAFSIKTKYFDSTLNYAVVKFTEPDLSGYFSMQLISEDRSTILEEIQNLNLDPNDERYVDLIIGNASGNIEVTYNPDYQFSEGEDVSKFEYIIRGGNDGIDGLQESDIIGSISDGLMAFSNPEVIDINLLSAPGWYQAEVTNAGIKICTDRGDAMYVAETPFGLTAQQANDWANGSGEFAADHSAFDSSYGALYWPWLQVSDPYTRKNIWLPPSGIVLAQYAYNDNVGQPWFAPAGLNRGVLTGVLAVEYSATKGERDTIYGNRNIVNPIINYRGQGLVIWGQKTMQRKPTALDRVNVRRLMNYLKKIISASTSYYVFEPNDEYSWNKWVDMVQPKLENVKQLRGVYEYKVKMEPTDDEIANNTMPGTIWLKPTKTAEFIPLNFMIMPQSASFEEII